MDRRSFLKGLFAGVAAAAAPKVFDLAPSWRKHEEGLYNPYRELTADALHRFALAQEDWLGTLHALYPNGQAPLTAVFGQLATEPLPAGKFEWWEKQFPTQRVLDHTGDAWSYLTTDIALRERDGMMVDTAQGTVLSNPYEREYELRWTEVERRARQYVDPVELVSQPSLVQEMADRGFTLDVLNEQDLRSPRRRSALEVLGTEREARQRSAAEKRLLRTHGPERVRELMAALERSVRQDAVCQAIEGAVKARKGTS